MSQEEQYTDGGNPTEKEREGDLAPSSLRRELKFLYHKIYNCSSLLELEFLEWDYQDVIEQCERRFSAWWITGEGCPSEFVPLKTLIEETRRGLDELERRF